MINQINQYLQIVGQASFVLGSILYLIFAIIVVKQVSTMSKNVYDKFNYVLIIFSYLHLIFAAFLVLLTVLIL